MTTGEETIREAARVIAEFNACGHCDGDCASCSEEAQALAAAGLLRQEMTKVKADREVLAREIEDLAYSHDDARSHVRNGGSQDWVNGWDAAATEAALRIRESDAKKAERLRPLKYEKARARVAELEAENDRQREILTSECDRANARVAELEAELADVRSALNRVRDLFASGPDTPCRMTRTNGVECVEVPMDDLRRALYGGDDRGHQ